MSQQIRSFDPSRVQRQHISPKLLVFGTDAPGVELRISRFIEVLRASGDDPSVYEHASDALGYLSSGDMFSPDVCVVVRDASDATGSSADSKRIQKSLLSAIGSYGEASTIVLGLPYDKPTAQVKAMISGMSAIGAFVREVSAPGSASAKVWLDEYLASTNRSLSEADKDKILAVSGSDIDQMRAVLTSVGDEIAALSGQEVSEWMNGESEATGADFRRAVMSRDAAALSSFRRAFAPGAQGYRTFLVKLRVHLTDLLIASASDGAEPLQSLRAGQYGSFSSSSAYSLCREASAADTARLSALLLETDRQLSAMAVSGTGDLSRLLSVLAAA